MITDIFILDEYAFEFNNQYLILSGLNKSVDGIVIRNVEEDAAVNYVLSTVKSPLIDGAQVTNKKANPREITITLGFENGADIRDCIDTICGFLAAPLAETTPVTIRKRSKHKTDQFYDTSRISGYISSINQIEFSNDCELEIVLLCEPFWRSNVTYTEGTKTWSSGTEVIPLSAISYRKGFLPSYWRLTLKITQHATAETVNFTLFIRDVIDSAFYPGINFSAEIPIVSASDTIKQCLIHLNCGINGIEAYQINATSAGTINEDDYTKIDLLPGLVYTGEEFPKIYKKAQLQHNSAAIHNGEMYITFLSDGLMVR